MGPDLRQRFHVLDDLPTPDLRPEIQTRRHHPNALGPDGRRLGVVAVAVVVAAAGLALVGRAIVGSRERPQAPPPSPPATSPSPASPSFRPATDDQAAAFTLQALTAAGIHDATDVYYDYAAIDQVDGRWLAYLCSSRPTSGVCAPDTADSFITIAQEEGDLLVTEASGAFTSEQQAALVGYRGSAELSAPTWVFEPIWVEHSQEAGLQAIASAYWSGPLPSKLAAACHVEGLDDHDAVVFMSREFVIRGRSDEGARDGVLVQELPSEVNVVNARVLCGEPYPEP